MAEEALGTIDGGILFASMGVLKRVPSTGGTASVIATPDASHAEVALRNPSFLPMVYIFWSHRSGRSETRAPSTWEPSMDKSAARSSAA
jgi:hypothetical protein